VRGEGRRSKRGVTHRLWILMTRAMNSDRAKGGTRSAVNPPFFPSLVFGIHVTLIRSALLRRRPSYLPRGYLHPLCASARPPAASPNRDLSITFSLFPDQSGEKIVETGYRLMYRTCGSFIAARQSCTRFVVTRQKRSN